MKTLPTCMIITSMLLLQSCSTPSKYPTEIASNLLYRQRVDTITPQTYPTKNPNTVAIYTPHKTPHAPYRIIGVATVAKHNLLGIQRKEDTMHTMIKNLAASIGGDGVIDINQGNEAMQGKVIAFQKILI